MPEVVIYLDNFDLEKRISCSDCSAAGTRYLGEIPFPLCKLAQLENNMGRKPNYGEALMAGIDTSGISKDCPNGYVSNLSREIR